MNDGHKDDLSPQIAVQIAGLDNWELVDGALVRELTFDSFPEAIAFINRVADLAEAANHHPELSNVYTRVHVSLRSHDVGGVTERDVELARQIDTVV